MKFSNLTIRWKILLPFIIVSIVFGLGLYLYFSDLYKSTLENAMVEKAQSIVYSAESAREYTSDQLEHDIFRDDIEDVDDFLYKVPIFSAIKITQEKAEELGYEAKVPKFSPRNPDNQPDEFEAEILRMLEKSGPDTEYYKIDENTNKLRYFKPIVLTEECMMCHGDPNRSMEFWGRSDGKDITGTKMEGWKVGEIHGAFEILMDMAPVQAQVREKSGLIALISTALTLFLVGIALLIANMISKPLNILENASKQIAAGNVNIKLDIKNNDETGSLAKAFNLITNKLSILIAEVRQISESAKNGDLEKRADESKLEGGYKEIIHGFNTTLDEVVEPLNIAAKNLELISAGNIPEKITDPKLTKVKAVQSVNELIDKLNLMFLEINNLTEESVKGNLDARGETTKFVGDYKKLMNSINDMLDTILTPVSEANRILSQISEGNINEMITENYNGDHEKMKNAVNNVALILKQLHSEIKMLIDAANEGNLTKRGNSNKFKGAYSELIIGTNKMLDAIIGPLNVTAEYVDKISNGELPRLIAEDYKGDFALIKDNINGLINNLDQFIKEMSNMSKEHDLGDIDVRIKSDEFKGFYFEMADGVNKMVNGHISVKKAAIHVFSEYGKGNFEANIDRLPGKKVFINDAIDMVQSNLKSINTEINTLIAHSINGDLSYRGNLSNLTGGWAEIISGVNSMLDAILDPIQETLETLEKMSEGDLSSKMTGDFKGDHAKLKNAINKTVELMPFKETIEVMTSLAEGNLTKEMNKEYKGDALNLKQAVNSSIFSFNDMLKQVKTMVDEVSQGSIQVSDASTSLSQGATEQAASLEEITSSMETIGSQIRSTAENADHAQTLTDDAKSLSEKGDNEMVNLNNAMNDISASSQNISKIIKAIDEIAFQTNLLALNAAVEAARAGRHGKGFAVVAEEVRNLAARSAKAAKETSDLIEKSIKTVDNGVQITTQTTKLLKDIRAGAEKSANIVNEMAVSAKEQAEGVLQINEGLKQIDQVTQTNTASSEESASAAEELSGQANQLKELLMNFKLKKNNFSFDESSIQNASNNRSLPEAKIKDDLKDLFD